MMSLWGSLPWVRGGGLAFIGIIDIVIALGEREKVS